MKCSRRWFPQCSRPVPSHEHLASWQQFAGLAPGRRLWELLSAHGRWCWGDDVLFATKTIFFGPTDLVKSFSEQVVDVPRKAQDILASMYKVVQLVWGPHSGAGPWRDRESESGKQVHQTLPGSGAGVWGGRWGSAKFCRGFCLTPLSLAIPHPHWWLSTEPGKLRSFGHISG